MLMPEAVANVRYSEAGLELTLAVVCLVSVMGMQSALAQGTPSASTQESTESRSEPRIELSDVDRAIPDPSHGAQIYRLCAECHSPKGPGTASSWVPEIAGQHPRVIHKQLLDYRSAKRWDRSMEAVASRHILKSAQDIADVAAYVATLTPRPSQSVGSGQRLPLGERRYASLCAACHGPRAEGDNSRRVPRLAGQRYEYLLRQLHDAVEGRRPNMAGGHARLLERFEMADFTALADYLSRLPVSAPRTQRLVLPD